MAGSITIQRALTPEDQAIFEGMSEAAERRYRGADRLDAVTARAYLSSVGVVVGVSLMELGRQAAELGRWP